MTSMDSRNSINGWYLTESELQDALASARMPNPSLDLSNPCNLNCPYCYIEEKDSQRKVRRPAELTLEETLAVIEDFHASGAKCINIVGAGEPTIDPHFLQVIEAIDLRGMITVLFTNGTRLAHDPALVRMLYRCSVSVVLKVNSTDPAIQDAIAGRAGYTAKRDAALDLLIDTGFAAHEPTRLGFDIMVFQANLAEIPSIHRFCRNANVFPIAGDYIPTGRTQDGSFHGYAALPQEDQDARERLSDLFMPPSAIEREQLRSDLEAIDDTLGIRHPQDCAYYGGGVCTQVLGLYVDIAGNIWPCVARKVRSGPRLIEEPLGNIRNGDSASKIWRSHPYIQDLRSTFTGGCPYKRGFAHGN